MIRTALVAAFTAAVVAAGWGCTQSPGSLAANRNPTARLAQMEEELSSLKRAQARLAEESAATALSLKAEREKTAGLAKERDGLRADLATRQAERDAARTKLDGFKTELRDLLARVEGSPAPNAAALGTGGF